MNRSHPSDQVVVLGAGLAGLSTACHLEALRPVVVLEREDRVGGLTRSFHLDGFVFDVTGHLLHLKRQPVKDLVARLLPDGLARVERRSSVHAHGVDVEYPFQANLHGLPAGVVRDCLLGFIAAATDPNRAGPEQLSRLSFQDWALATFGEGIARHFMLPYNRKLLCRDLSEVTAEWVSWSVPQPTLEEVVGGALGLPNRRMGYNPTFLYPAAGGIEILPNALAASLRNAEVRLRTEVEEIDPAKRVVRTADGETFRYEDLVSTLPLPSLIRRVQGVPSHLAAAAAGLSATTVLNVNLGVARPELTEKHWIYYPEDRFIFYRVGCPTAFCGASAPPGCSSLYVEVARPSILPAEVPELEARVHQDLVACGLLRSTDRIVARHTVVVSPAYVVYDRHRQRHLPSLLAWLEERRIRSIGRYGLWEYAAMEDAIAQGMETAALLARSGPACREAAPLNREPACPPPAASR